MGDCAEALSEFDDWLVRQLAGIAADARRPAGDALGDLRSRRRRACEASALATSMAAEVLCVLYGDPPAASSWRTFADSARPTANWMSASLPPPRTTNTAPA